MGLKKINKERTYQTPDSESSIWHSNPKENVLLWRNYQHTRVDGSSIGEREGGVNSYENSYSECCMPKLEEDQNEKEDP